MLILENEAARLQVAFLDGRSLTVRVLSNIKDLMEDLAARPSTAIQRARGEEERTWRRGRTSGEALVAGVDERAGARKGAGRPRKS